MRCLSCNEALNDYESTRKYAGSHEYVDLCNRCFRYIKHDVYSIDRPDLEGAIDDLELSSDVDRLGIDDV